MKKSERILLGVFAVLFIVIIGGGALAYGLSHYRGIQEETARLHDRLVEMNEAINEGAEWQRRSEWLDTAVPVLASRQEASSRLLEALQKEAEKAGLVLAGREFLETPKELGEDGQPLTEGEGYFDKATVRLTLSGVKEQALFAWMHAVQQPRSFLGVTRLQMSPSGKGKTVNAEVEVTQFYREGTAKAASLKPEGGQS